MLAAILCNQTIRPRPPVARYGPALTPAERARWFGLDFESPRARRKKRALCERLKREAFGILEPEKCEEMVEARLVEAIAQVSERQAPARRAQIDPARLFDGIVGQIAREVRADIERAEIAKESDEAFQIARTFFDEQDAQNSQALDALDQALAQIERLVTEEMAPEPKKTALVDEAVSATQSAIRKSQDSAHDPRLDKIVTAIEMITELLNRR